MKKVLILTHELGVNYGGIMQAYALQKVVTRLGFSVVTSNFHKPSIYKIIAYTKYLTRKTLCHINPSVSDLPPFVERYTTKNTLDFIERNILTIPKSKLHNMKLIQSFDALLVGSDQVWRQAYVPVDKYLFDFVKNFDIPRISYAASFGNDDLSEYSVKLIAKTARLAKKFKAISVREDSALDIVKKYWGVVAVQHLDPTMLLNKEHYVKLIVKDVNKLYPTQGNLFAYVLDKSSKKSKIIENVAKNLGLKPFEIIPLRPTSHKELKSNLGKYQLPRVTQWLKSFMDAEFIVTDSFHGCTFSIIFNKPFIAIGNQERGIARFTSLLKNFGLEDRLISNATEITDHLLKRGIDWKKVNEKVNNEQKRSIDYLERNL